MLKKILLLSVLVSAISSPTEIIDSAIEKARAIVKNPAFSGAANIKVRRDALKKAIYPAFDFEEFSRRALGRYWKDLTSGEQKEFVGLFRELLEHQYIGYIEQLSDEKFMYLKERIDGNYAEVSSKVITANGDLKIDYKLNLVGERWKIYDLIINDISIVNNYRSQFYRKLQGISIDILLKEMREKVRGLDK